MDRRRLILTGAVLMLLILAAPVAANSVGGDEAWIKVRCNIDGAVVYFDNDYKGTIESGELNVAVLTTAAPYHTVKAQMDGYYTASAPIGGYPAVGETSTVYLTLNPVPTPAPPTTGTLSVSSSPSGAKVYVDGAYYGRTPQKVTGLAAKSHTLEVRLDGYDTWSSSQRVKAGETTSVRADLNPHVNYGSIYVTSSPSGAKVYLDGTYEGKTPRTITGISEGRHYIELEEAGYQEWTGPVTVVAGQQTYVSATLNSNPKPVSGTIDVFSNPVGAYIYLDGEYQGQTYPEGYVIIGVTPGTHTVTLKLTGYKDVSSSVNVNSGQDSSVRMTLEPAVPSGDTGSMEITSTPAGAEVYLNNEYWGVTPVTLRDLTTGSYTVTLKLAGHPDWSTTAQVNAGAKTPVAAQFAEPAPTQQSPAPLLPVLGALALFGCIAARMRH
ncbi:PEGA domain-containing protein [Methanofollis formosanus]|uniref:PEGA domain-containing protein n=1 Tax=Methanofollis formosanus TaxID=299308 RepID=A0A8G1A218_9EURY|nr:PEGA domain-containing protein [Methanofollis formosanus]QYZ78978.1 PEGA domain-containing protein [Methanofollis formosanus]